MFAYDMRSCEVRKGWGKGYDQPAVIKVRLFGLQRVGGREEGGRGGGPRCSRADRQGRRRGGTSPKQSLCLKKANLAQAVSPPRIF